MLSQGFDYLGSNANSALCEFVHGGSKEKSNIVNSTASPLDIQSIRRIGEQVLTESTVVIRS